MNASELRKIAQGISDRFAQASANALGCEQQYVRMAEDPRYGAADVEYARKISEIADDEANALAEQEYHAWEAYNDASQAEYFDYLAEQDSHLEMDYEDRHYDY